MRKERVLRVARICKRHFVLMQAGCWGLDVVARGTSTHTYNLYARWCFYVSQDFLLPETPSLLIFVRHFQGLMDSGSTYLFSHSFPILSHFF